MIGRDTGIIVTDLILFKYRDFSNNLSKAPCFTLQRFQVGQKIEKTVFISLWVNILVLFASTPLPSVTDLLTNSASNNFKKLTVKLP